ncbi:molecular chaperone [Nannochloropsis oceanica]
MAKVTPKLIYYRDETAQKLIAGINTVANVVKATLGPRGRNVVLMRDVGYPEVINDGVTIARDINLPDPAMQVGAKLIKAVASKSDSIAGDGTTTSTLMTQVLINKGYKMIMAGANAIGVWRGMKKASDILLGKLKTLARPISSSEDIHNIATIASGSAVMGAIIAKGFERVGVNGQVVIEESPTMLDEIDFTEGMNYDNGFVDSGFITDTGRACAELEKPYVLVTNHVISNLREMVTLLETFANSERQLLIIAEDIKGEAREALVMNKERGSLKVAAMKGPGFGVFRQDYYTDIAIATGATFVAKETGIGLEKVTLDMLGQATKAILRQESATLLLTGKHKDAVNARIASIRESMDDLDSMFDKEKSEERIASLAGGVARIRVGAATEVELKDKKLRYEDAVNSVKNSLKYGVLPGGGTTLLYLKRYRDEVVKTLKADGLDDEVFGADILFDALSEPMRQIAENAGKHGNFIVSKCVDREFGYGFNAATLTFENLLEAGVLDAATVTENSLANSVSVASLVLTSGGMVVEDEAGMRRLEREKIMDYAKAGGGMM